MATAILSDLLAYDPTSKTCLRWKVSPSNRAKAGSEAGCFFRAGRTSTYYVVRAKKKLMLAHRVVWELNSGEPVPEGMDIDHIDGNGLNNVIENLRVVPRAINLRNQGKSIRNTSGFTGVSFSARDMGYRAYYNDENGKAVFAFFGIKRHGSKESALQAAIDWRLRMVEMRNQQGAGYTERHITGA